MVGLLGGREGGMMCVVGVLGDRKGGIGCCGVMCRDGGWGCAW